LFEIPNFTLMIRLIPAHCQTVTARSVNQLAKSFSADRVCGTACAVETIGMSNGSLFRLPAHKAIFNVV